MYPIEACKYLGKEESRDIEHKNEKGKLKRRMKNEKEKL